MIPYYAIFLLIAIFAFFESFQASKRQRLIIHLGLAIVLIVFAGLRYQPLANDFQAYTNGIIDITKNGLNYSELEFSTTIFEPGYNLLVYIATLISFSPAFVFLVVASVAVGITMCCYVKYSPKYFILAALFYFIHTFVLRDMSLIRSGVAAAIGLYALRYIETRSLVKFVLTIIIAMSFHLASIVILLVYPIYHLNWRAKTWGYLVLGSLIIAYIMPFGKLLMLLPVSGIFARISNYSWMIGDSLGVLTNPTILKQLFFVSLSIAYYKVLIQKIPNFKLMFVPYVMSVCWLLVWNDFPIVSGRMATFFSITEVIVIPSMLVLVTPKSRPILILLLILLAFMILYLNGSNYLGKVTGLLPYQFAPLH